MNRANLFSILSTVVIAVIFFWSVFLNLNIKNSKNKLEALYEEIEEIQLDIKRQNIEITTLTNPQLIIKYIKDNGLQPVPLNQMHYLEVNN
jgi:cell division protein FtsL